MMKTKIIAMYLPQYHSIPENDEFWGDGFTDWVTVKNAAPLKKWHEQPKVPFNLNYYDLSQKDNVKWQARIAKENGVYGFGIYHYWFNKDKNILTKPAEIIRDNDDIDINYFLAWDNASWKRSWSNIEGNDWAPSVERGLKPSGPQVLIEYVLGNEEDWLIHYKYLKTHFVKDKYIKIDNKPVFIIWSYSSELLNMCSYWNKLAINDGFDGIHFVFRYSETGKLIRKPKVPQNYTTFTYEPIYHGWSKLPYCNLVFNKIKKICGYNKNKHLHVYDYDEIWKKILKDARTIYVDDKIIHGAFVNYDDTPRRGMRGKIVANGSPQKFYNYLNELVRINEEQHKDFIFLTAWNEWGEGAYLEPDMNNGCAYLDAIKKIFKHE